MQLSKGAEQHKSSQGSPSAANPTTDTQPDTPSLNASALADLVELLKDESAARHRQRRPAHMRARSYCNSGVLFCALGAALTSPLFGVNFQEHWHLPQVCQQGPLPPLQCHG